MGVEYDELFISTMKEIDVCKGAIKKLSKALADMEMKYSLSTAEFIERFQDGRMEDKKDYTEWHGSFIGLKSWKQRLKELDEILQRHSSPGKVG